MNFVNVAIRIRPFFAKNCEDNNCLDVIHGDPPTLFVSEKQQAYSFDKIFDGDSDQEEIFSDVVAPLVEKAILGYNCTVFAYGQTGTGKTYTMGSDLKELNGKNVGIITRVFESIFSKTSFLKNIDVEVSICEIYQEKVYDLLGDTKTALVVKGFNIIDLTKTKIDNMNSVQKLLYRSCKRRHTGGTKQNAWSSRSHAIFTIFINFQNGHESKCTKLNLVDLAGCESVKKTGTQDNQFNEAVKINMGLLSIGQVINALSSNKTCVPYRESMITRILHDSLSKRNFMTLIACVNPNSTDIQETWQTLEFAVKAKKLKNKPELNSILQECPKTVPSKYRSTPLHEMRTPMKRPNQATHSLTSVKRPRLDPQTKNAIFSENFSRNSGVDSSVISPIAKMVITKLEDRIPQKTDFFKCAELYDTMRQLIREEVHSLTINNLTLATPAQKNKQKIRKTLLPPDENQLPISSSPIDMEKINNNDFEEGISLIRTSPNEDLHLSGIIPHEQNNGGCKENVLTRRGSSPKFKVPLLPRWASSANTNRPLENKNSFAFSTPLATDNHNSHLRRKSARLSTPKYNMTILADGESNSKRISLDRKEECTERDSLDKSGLINENLDRPRRSIRLSMKASNVLLQKETNTLLDLSKSAENSSESKSSGPLSVTVMENMRSPKERRKSIRKSIMKSSTIKNTDSVWDTKCEHFNIKRSSRKSVKIAECRLSDKIEILPSSTTIMSNVYEESSKLQKKNNYRESKHKFSLRKQSDSSTDSESSYVSIQRSSKARKSIDIIDTSQEDIFDENTLRTFPAFARRRSIRLLTKQSQSIVIDNLMATSNSPYKSPRESLSKEKKMEVLKNNILKIINKGNLQNLKTLHTIGAKTAEQILLYRQLNGPYKAIGGLKQILTRGRSFERFLTANCLSIDNI